MPLAPLPLQDANPAASNEHSWRVARTDNSKQSQTSLVDRSGRQIARERMFIPLPFSSS